MGHILTMKSAAFSRDLAVTDLVAGALEPVAVIPIPATDSLPQVDWDDTAVTEKVVQIKTKFDPASEHNRKTPFATNRAARESATQKYRNWVKTYSKAPKTFSGFKDDVSGFTSPTTRF